MTFDDLELGTTVTLEIKQASTVVNVQTTIENKKNDLILLEPIRIEGKIAGFNDNVTVNLQIPGGNKLNVWNNVRVLLVKFEKTIYHAIKIEGESVPINRRGAYRVFMGQTMKVITFTSTGPEPREVLVKDISELGFAFISSEPMHINSVVRLQMPVRGDAELKLTSKIVRLSPKNRGETIYGCKFSERNRILSDFLMKRQLEKAKENALV